MDSNNNNNGPHLNPATTEHLKLFNPTFKKKKGPPKKVTIIDPQEFKNPDLTFNSVINSNVLELLPDLRSLSWKN